MMVKVGSGHQDLHLSLLQILNFDVEDIPYWGDTETMAIIRSTISLVTSKHTFFTIV